MSEAQETIRGSVEDYEQRREMFNKLVLPYKNMIYKLCIQYTLKGGEWVEENYNAVLENLFLYVKTYNPEMSIKTWIHICTKRHIYQIDKARQCTVVSGRGDKSSIIQVDIEMIDEESSDDDPTWRQVSGYNKVGDEKMLETCLGDDLLNALNSINPLYKRLLYMQYDGMSNKEIAKILHKEGIMQTADAKIVKSKMNAARQKLRRMINRDGKRIV